MGAQHSIGCGNPGWHAVLCVHVSWMFWTGLLKGLGVLLPTLQQQFMADAGMIGGLIATATAVGSLAGPLSKPLEALFGTRIVVIVCGFLLGASVIASSFLTSAIQMTLVLSLFAGPGLMITNVLSRALTGRYFTTNYGTVNGIGTAGDAVGLVSFAPLTQVLLDTYGWRGALLLLGAISMHLGVCGLLLRPSPTSAEGRDDYLPIVLSEEEPLVDESTNPNAEKIPILRILKDAVIALGNSLGCAVCSRGAFWIAWLVSACHVFVGSLWLIYFVAYAESKGFSGYEAVTFTTCAGIGSLVFKVFNGYVVDQGWIELRWALLILIIISGLALFLLPLLSSYWLMIVNAFIFNGCVGGLSSIGDIYTRELLGAEDLVSAFSWMDLITAIFQISLGFFPGWIFDQTGSYDEAFVILGFISLLPLVSLLVEKLLSRRKE